MKRWNVECIKKSKIAIDFDKIMCYHVYNIKDGSQIMKIIRTERGKGKTTELIKQSARDGSYILCMNQANAHYVYDMAEEMGFNIPFPITPSNLPLRGFKGSVLIDEIDYILPPLIGTKVDAITTSSPIDTLDDKNTTRGLYKMYIADEVTIRDLDDNYIAETDNTEMAFRIVDLLTEQDLARIGSALLYALKDNEYCLASYKGNHLRSMKTVDDLLEWYDNEQIINSIGVNDE